MSIQGDVKRNDVGQTITGPWLHALPTVDATVNGPSTYAFVAGATLAAGDCVVLNSSSKWVLTDANTASLYLGLKGIVVIGGASDAYVLVALPGSIVYLTAFATLTVGTSYFLSETAGALTATMPTTGTSGQVRVGVAVHADMMYVTMDSATAVSGA